MNARVLVLMPLRAVHNLSQNAIDLPLDSASLFFFLPHTLRHDIFVKAHSCTSAAASQHSQALLHALLGWT